MDEANMIGVVVIGAGALISILAPLFRINSSITRMQSSVDHMLENDRRRDERINKHGNEIDEEVRQVDRNGVTIKNMQTQLEKHDVRINELERKIKDA